MFGKFLTAFDSCKLREIFIERFPQRTKRGDGIIVMLESVVPVFPVLYQKEMLAVTVIPKPIQFLLNSALWNELE
jgi:hypothetical protein